MGYESLPKHLMKFHQTSKEFAMDLTRRLLIQQAETEGLD